MPCRKSAREGKDHLLRGWEWDDGWWPRFQKVDLKEIGPTLGPKVNTSQKIARLIFGAIAPNDSWVSKPFYLV
jgi:hypothetical protein